MTDKTESISKEADIYSLQKQWDEILRPVFVEHPHDAVVLICTSYEKSCRSYICDTSHRHSNHLDRFRKLRMNSSDYTYGYTSTVVENVDADRPHSSSLYDSDSVPFLIQLRQWQTSWNGVISAYLDEIFGNPKLGQAQDESHAEGCVRSDGAGGTLESNCLKCHLCRGAVLGWMIDEEARQYMDLKLRSCSKESCLFSGNEIFEGLEDNETPIYAPLFVG